MRGLLTGIAIGLAVAGLGVMAWLRWLDLQVGDRLSRRYDVALERIRVPRDSASLAEGGRLAHVLGCHGCHGQQLQGRVIVDEPSVMRLVAPNLAPLLPAYSDAELARLIRHGVRRDGTGVLVMPAAAFHHLREADVARLVAYLRTVPPAANAPGRSELRLPGKLAVLKGALQPGAASIDHRAPRADASGEGEGAGTARGAYLVRVACTECHGADLRGALDAPSLLGANGYGAAEFVSLLLDGRSRDGRDLPTMGKTARERFVRLTKEEIAGIHAYLVSLSAAPAVPRFPERAR
ncbi:MAG TPA: c-type cytochrome [Gemmatimonadaceae bacterium]|nr:c-type cytochrome [Gemmatimonadaceae bacterium]